MKTNMIHTNSIKTYICAIVMLLGMSASTWGVTITLKAWNKSTSSYVDVGTFEKGDQPGYGPSSEGYYTTIAWAPGTQTADTNYPTNGGGNNGSTYYNLYGFPTQNYNGDATTLYAVYSYGGYYTTAPDVQFSELVSCTQYDIVPDQTGIGEVEVDGSACEDAIVEFSATPGEGYAYDGATILYEDYTEVTLAAGDPKQFTMPAQDVLLNVVFTVQSYDATLKPNGGSGSDQVVQVTYGEIPPTTLKAGGGAVVVPTRTGYDFDGYYDVSASTGGTQYYSYSGNPKALTPENLWNKANDADLYARWIAKETLITLDKNGGNADGVAQVTYDGASLDDIAHATTNTTGYNLDGYYTNDATPVKVLNADGSYAASNVSGYITSGKWSNANAEITLYAHWALENYSITYKNLNGASNTGNPDSYTIESANISLADPGSRTGYAFDGWYTNAGLSDAAGTPAIATGSTGNKTFYAKWTANEIIITLSQNGGIADGAATVFYDGTSATITTAVTHATKSLKGYYTAASEGTKVLEADGAFAATDIDGYITDGKWTKADATTLHAQWLTVERTVTFDLDDKGDNFTRKVENGTPVSKPTPDPTHADYKFVKWVTTDGGDTEFDFSQNITANVTVYSKWAEKTYSKRIFACVDISVGLEDSKKVLVTSRNGMNIMAVNKLLVTVNGALAGHTVSITSTDGLKFYKLSGGKYVELTGAANVLRAPLDDEPVYVSYNPTSAGDGSITNPTFTIACDGESQEFNTSGEYVRARNIPDAVAIVANVGGSWHGLSANIATATTPKDQMVAVASVGEILKAYAPTADFGYALWPVLTVNSTNDRWGNASGSTPAKLYGDRLRFAGKDSKALRTNNTADDYKLNNIGTIAGINTSFTDDDRYEWKVTTREVDGQFIYTFQTDQTNNTRYLRLWNGRWGVYQDGKGTEDMYLLPIVETALVDMQPYEWGTDQVVVYYSTEATTVALTSVNVGSEEAASPTFAQIDSSDLWRVSGLTGMIGKPAQQLQVMITEDGVAKQGLLQIPLIVNGEKTEQALRLSLTGANATEKNKVAKNTDVVILKGGRLTTETASGNFKDLYIYAGGKAIITNAMSFGDMYMRGGFGYIGAETWDVARTKIDAAVTLSGKLYYDLTMDDTKYYDLAVPYEVDLNEATDDKGDDDFNVWLKIYDGAKRASDLKKGWDWYDWSGDLKLHPGTGYLIEATPRYKRPYCTVRFPMNPDLSSGETAVLPISVTAHGMNEDGTMITGKTANNVGWNFIANPYMCEFGTANITESDEGVLQIGELVENDDHKYEWDTEGVKKIRYVTTFNYNSQEYAQHPLSSTTLDPFTGFFVQVGKTGSVNFTTAGRQLLAPAYLRVSDLPKDMEIVLKASGNGQSDEMRLHINDELTLSNALEFPDEMTKQINTGKLNIYTISNNTNMYANGMSYEDAQEWIPAGFIAPAEGTYTFTVDNVNEHYIKSILLKDMNSGFEYDLMKISPELVLNAETNDERFAVKIVLNDQSETPTGVDELQTDGTQPLKFIYHDKVYILYNGVIYDSTGKKIK